MPGVPRDRGGTSGASPFPACDIVGQTARALDRLFRAESGPVLATLIRVLGDFQLAEDALQDALTAALETWPNDGLPTSPGAWLATTARRKARTR